MVARLAAPSVREAVRSGADERVDSPATASDALRAGLVNELELLVAPVALGVGVPLTPAGLHLDLDLRELEAWGRWYACATACASSDHA